MGGCLPSVQRGCRGRASRGEKERVGVTKPAMGTAAYYARLDYYSQHQRTRRERYVMNRRPLLACQDCRGEGGERVPILDDGTGPFEMCGWCLGIGYMTAWERGEWLRTQRREKATRRGFTQRRRAR